jgi:DNA replication licensing factor MCM3
MQMTTEENNNRSRRMQEMIGKRDPTEAEILKYKADIQEMMDKQKNKVKAMVTKGVNRLTLQMDDVRKHSKNLANLVLWHPLTAIRIFEEQLNAQAKQYGSNSGEKGEKQMNAADAQFPTKTKIYYINFEGGYGKNYVTPRGLKAEKLNNMVQVQGIVTKMSLVKPKIQTSVHYCEATKKGHIKHYTDHNNLGMEGSDALNDNNNAFPTKDANDNPLSAEYGYCVYKDYQTIVL